MAKDFQRVANRIEKFPIKTLDGAVAIRDYLNGITTPNATKRVLTQLNACCNWAVESKIIAANPFVRMAAGIKAPKGKTDEEDIDPFTPDERDRIIQAFWDKNSKYADLVEFLFRTGCRPSEALGLQWKHIAPEYRTHLRSFWRSRSADKASRVKSRQSR